MEWVYLEKERNGSSEMPSELTYPHIEKPDGQPARLERLPRIRVSQIAMDYLAHAWTPDEMCRQHPNLTLAEAHAAMGYYFDHQDEIDQEIHLEIEQLREGAKDARRSPFHHRLRLKGLQ